MNILAFLILWFVNYSAAQDPDCDYRQDVAAGNTFLINNIYSTGRTCRYIAICPSGYNCRVNCSSIELPQSPSCSMDRLLVSRSGNSQLAGADIYCGSTTLTAVSTGQTISVGLIASASSPGGRFLCELKAVQSTTDS